MPYCYPCGNRYFRTHAGLEQHIENSDAHRPGGYDWECLYCDEGFKTERARRQHHASAPGHPYCKPCDRMFMNQNNLMQHMHSRVHQGSKVVCPWCKNSYTTASGLTIHLESGSCSSGLNRQQINQIVQRMDRNNIITLPMISLPDYDDVETIATARSWNGRGFECPLCPREFSTLGGLNKHLKSPAHERDIYRCPGRACTNTYKTLSGLVQHIESESCGLMRFSNVQSQVKKGLGSMVGRLIAG